MIDTQYPQQGSLPEDQQNSNPDKEQQQVVLPEEISLVADGDCPYDLDLEDFLTGDALIDEYLAQYVERFQQEAKDAYQGFQKNKDWLKMAIKLLETMRAYYEKDPDTSAPFSPEKHKIQKKYERNQRQANTLVAVFLRDALNLLDKENPETARSYIEQLLDRVQDEYAVSHSVSMGASRMAYMYWLFINVLEKWLRKYNASSMTQQAPVAEGPGENMACTSLLEFAYLEFKKLDTQTQDELRRTRTKDKKLYEIKLDILARFLGVTPECARRHHYKSRKSDISRAVDRLRQENG
ncbi:MAG: hypothetical protein HGB02_06170 [Chlorobiaceae bacterium]|nr:hypothetical protein [Chlorobiaceae bacterium]